MKFFVWFTTYKHDPERLEVFNSEADLLEFLNSNAGNIDFSFMVVEGREVPFKPVSVATKYVRDPLPVYATKPVE